MSRIVWVVLLVACSGSPKATTCPVCPVCPAVAKADDTQLKPMPDETPPTPPAKPAPPPTKPTSTITANDLEPGGKAGSGKTQAEIAAKLNAQGVVLAKTARYSDASAKFRDAVARVPDPAHFVNLCFSLFHEGKFGEALTACNAVNGTPAQNAKRDKLMEHIKYEAAVQGINVTP